MAPQLTDATILVVSDDDAVALPLLSMLHQVGYNAVAVGGGAAPAALRDGGAAVIMIDLSSPSLKGDELLQEATRQRPPSICLALAASSLREEAIKAVARGDYAQYVAVPADEHLLRQAVGQALAYHQLLQERDHLQNLVSAQHKALVASHELQRQELVLGGKICAALAAAAWQRELPEALEVEVVSITGREVDGAFYDLYHPTANALDLAVGEVLGKGLSAAVVSTAVKMQLTRYAMPLLSSNRYDRINFWQEDLHSPKEIVTLLYQQLYRQLAALEIFTALFYGRFDLEKRALRYVGCGFSRPLHWKAATKTVSILEGQNMPLGSGGEADFVEQTESFEKGDLFLFASEGLVQVKNSQGTLFDHRQLEDILREHGHRPPSELIHLIRRSLAAFSARASYDKDVTIIAIKVKEIPKGTRTNKSSAQFNSHLSQLHSVREFIGRLCHGAPGDDATLINQLQLAINEVFTNIVKHGYDEKVGQKVIIQGYWIEDGVCIDISDQGVSFNPARVSEPDLLGERESGFGWYIIKSIADEITYTPRHSASGWNHLTLYKRFILEGTHMELLKEQRGKTWILTPKCESLDAKNTREFKQQVLDTLGQDSLASVILDLSLVNYVDSSGLGSLLSILKYLHSRGGDLKLANLNKPVRTIFELVAMHKIFEIYNDTADALNAADRV